MEKTIQEAVAEKIISLSSSVSEIVINNLAQQEIDNRVSLITIAIGKQEQLEKDLKKINKCDIVTYPSDGGSPIEAMSKGRYDEIKKAQDNLGRLVESIEKALTENSTDAYNRLSESLKKLGNAGNPKAEG